ncbi:MAG: Arm DNA-binding domain-containing protein [Novosphingobium sp.]|uniref:Arm DNA-binding domain-containing protein n=1 Tax=Novosphingobium sp. TaxID=1874826 RepID=UPI003C7E3A59
MPKKLGNVLTPLAVKNAKPGRHADGGGLHLLVKEGGARSWVYRFILSGKSRDVGLGTAGPDGISLADARDARDALRLKVKGGDPLEERQQEAVEALAGAQAAQVAGITSKAGAETYIGANKGSLSPVSTNGTDLRL